MMRRYVSASSAVAYRRTWWAPRRSGTGDGRPSRSPSGAPITPESSSADRSSAGESSAPMWVAFVIGERVRLHEPGQTELGHDVRRWSHAGEGVRRIPCRDR